MSSLTWKGQPELFKFDSRRHRCKEKPPAYDRSLAAKEITTDKRVDFVNEKWPENLACCHKRLYLNACAAHDSFPLRNHVEPLHATKFAQNIDAYNMSFSHYFKRNLGPCHKIKLFLQFATQRRCVASCKEKCNCHVEHFHVATCLRQRNISLQVVDKVVYFTHCYTTISSVYNTATASCLAMFGEGITHRHHSQMGNVFHDVCLQKFNIIADHKKTAFWHLTATCNIISFLQKLRRASCKKNCLVYNMAFRVQLVNLFRYKLPPTTFVLGCCYGYYCTNIPEVKVRIQVRYW